MSRFPPCANDMPPSKGASSGTICGMVKPQNKFRIGTYAALASDITT